MTPVDDAAFSRGLVEAFPGLLFFKYPQSRRGGVRMFDSFAVPGEFLVTAALPPEGWTFDANCPDAADWNWYTARAKSIRYVRSEWDWTGYGEGKWAFDPPTLTVGSISAAYFADDPAGKRFVDKVLRLLKKITTNRVRIQRPKLGISSQDGAGAYWAGFDALRWCSEQPTRMLAGLYRPASNWSFPDDHPWYRGLDVDRGVSDRPPAPVLRGPGGVYIAPDDFIDRIRAAKREDEA
jgi:hypothetical protein